MVRTDRSGLAANLSKAARAKRLLRGERRDPLLDGGAGLLQLISTSRRFRRSWVSTSRRFFLTCFSTSRRRALTSRSTRLRVERTRWLALRRAWPPRRSNLLSSRVTCVRRLFSSFSRVVSLVQGSSDVLDAVAERQRGADRNVDGALGGRDGDRDGAVAGLGDALLDLRGVAARRRARSWAWSSWCCGCGWSWRWPFSSSTLRASLFLTSLLLTMFTIAKRTSVCTPTLDDGYREVVNGPLSGLIKREPARPAPASGGVSSSPRSGSSAGDRQTVRSDAGPASATTASQNALPSSYWRSFSSMPSSRAISSPSPPRRARRSSRRRRSSASPGPRSAAAGVHHVLGVPLDHRHRRLQAVEQATPLGIGEQPRELAAQQRADDRAGVAEQAAAERGEAGRVEALGRALDQPAASARMCGGEPVDALELDHVRGLVQRDPAQEERRDRRRGCAAPPPGSRRRTAAAPGARGPNDRDVVLAEHPLRGVAGREPGLGRRPRRRVRAARSCPAAREGSSSAASASLDGAAASASVASAFRAQARRSTQLGRRAGRRPRRARRRRRPFRSPRRRRPRPRLRCSRRRRSTRRPRPGIPEIIAPATRSASPQSTTRAHASSAAASRWISSSVPSISSSRPAAIGNRAARSRPTASGSRLAELDAGARLAGDQLGGGDVDRAAQAGAEHAVEPARRRRNRA